MSDFFHDKTSQRAAKRYRCIYCGECIEQGQVYIRQSGVWEGEFFTNRFHPECFADLLLCDDEEFSPYSAPRPPSAAELEFQSWDCAALAQGRLL